MKIPYVRIQGWIEAKLEPILEGFIEDELIVYINEKKENFFKVDLYTKILQEPGLFGDNYEYLVHRAPLYKVCRVKKRNNVSMFLECRLDGQNFFLDVRIKTKENT